MKTYVFTVPFNTFKLAPEKYLDIIADMSLFENHKDLCVYRARYGTTPDTISLYKYTSDLSDADYLFMKLKHDINLLEVQG